MEKKSTEDLENTLKSTHIRDFDRFRETNRESLAEGEELFSGYIKEKIRKKGLTQQMVFLMAARIPRDALLMIAFNERSGSVLDVNTLLKKHGMESLRPSGVQD